MKRILERYGCIYDSSDGDSCFLYKFNGWFFQYISNEGKLFSLYRFDVRNKLNNQLINKYEEVYEGKKIQFLKNLHSFLVHVSHFEQWIFVDTK